VIELREPIVQAPLGGGPSTPALAAAVAEAGGLGFLAAGYKTPAAVKDDIDELRRLTDRPFGVNLFAKPGPAADAAVVARYAATLAGEGPLGEPRHDDDHWGEKLELVIEERVPVVSVTFGVPSREEASRLDELWVTVTTPHEARLAREAGAAALVVQGAEAGGHRGSFDDDTVPAHPLALLALLERVRAASDLPLVASGGLMTGAAVAAVLAAGASAAQLGTAFMLTPEAGTAPAHREALRGDAPTALTRAFTGRLARGIVNRFMIEHSDDAPSAYPEIHHVTAPLRAAARERGDRDGFHLWAGEGYRLADEAPAAEVVGRLATDYRESP
jgi:nitronate monooxygenase